MSNNPTAIEIIETLLPTLRLAGDYACTIQKQVRAQPEKEGFGDNFYATALTDADLTVQTAVELVLLAKFPQIRFFGEEHETSYNTKYFRAITLGEEDELLITLDPIDGTRAYLDGLPCFAIIISVIRNRSYEAAFVLQPRYKNYIYALKGKGAFIGNINDNLENTQPLLLEELKSRKIYLSFALTDLRHTFANNFETWCSAIDYAPDQNPPEYLDLVKGNLAAVLVAKGNLIDGAALAFIASESGAIVTTFDGENWQPFSKVENMKIPGLIVAHNRQIHTDILHHLSANKSAKSVSSVERGETQN